MLLCIKHAHGQDSNSMQSSTWFDSCCRPKCNGRQATSISLQKRGKKTTKEGVGSGTADCRTASAHPSCLLVPDVVKHPGGVLVLELGSPLGSLRGSLLGLHNPLTIWTCCWCASLKGSCWVDLEHSPRAPRCHAAARWRVLRNVHITQADT